LIIKIYCCVSTGKKPTRNLIKLWKPLMVVLFDEDAQRVAFLFELYQKLSGELFVEGKKRGKG